MADNPLAMSDEDFLKQNGPRDHSAEDNALAATDDTKTGTDGAEDGDAAATTSTEAAPATEESKPEEKPAAEEPKPEAKPNGEAKGDNAPSGSEAEPKPGEEKPAAGAEATPDAPGATTPEGTEKPADGAEKPAAPIAETPAAPDYEAIGKAIMAPFTANGKKIELKNEAEAIQLMQMGANYTRKLQEMAPNRKILAMLGNNSLLNESKLSFLISLDKGDPEAIKKLIMDKGIDPLDIDTKIEPAYLEGSYAVSDGEVEFRTQVEELSSSDTGRQTLQTITDDWDQASKDLLWAEPSVMAIIHSQRENGIYTKITAELDRQRTLGKILPTTPFLEAYKAVGDQLHAAGAFGKPPEKGGEQPGAAVTVPAAGGESPAPEVLATRAAEPRPAVDNGDRAGAASPSRAAAGTVKEVKNYLAMSDDDFMKSDKFKDRV